MEKRLSVVLYPITIIITILAFLHLSYFIDYKSIDGTFIGFILLLISNCICLFYIYNFSNKKKIEYSIFSISIIVLLFILLQNEFQIIEFSNQRIIPIISYISIIIIVLPLISGLINYIYIIKNIKK